MTSSTASRHVNAYLESLPQPQQAFAQKLREMLFELVPRVEERFSFKLPFYHYYGMFCYLHADKNGLHFCVCRGKDLLIAFPQLEQKNRASIASIVVNEWSDFSRLEISAMIMAAADWNKEASLQKIPILQKKKKVN
ncbi:MAG TPA: DUF1801 domain-containing protein [Flavisolibacter sp.]